MGAAEIVYRHRNARRGSNLWASAGFGDVANCAGNRMLSEKDPPGFQQTPSRWRLSEGLARGVSLAVNSDADTALALVAHQIRIMKPRRTTANRAGH